MKRGPIGLDRSIVLQAVEKHNGNRSAAARELGVTLNTISYHVTSTRRTGADRLARHAEVLATVARIGNVRDAARALGITRQAVEQHVKQHSVVAHE